MSGVVYSVALSYPTRKSETEKGIAVDYHQDILLSTKNKVDAMNMAKSHKLRPNDFVYVTETRGRDTRTIKSFTLNQH